MLSENSFFVVWNPDGSSPRCRHAYENDAELEAKRLAAKHPGQAFYVLRAESVSQHTAVATTRLARLEFDPF